MDMVIKGGSIVTSQGRYRADIGVEGGSISAIAERIPTDGAKSVDASGKYVLPGAIDVHTHLAMPFGGTVSADDYFAGTRAAACGGTTTVFDFAMQEPGERLADTVRRRDALCRGNAAVDYAFHVAIRDVEGALLDSMDEALEIGVASFKVFMVYDFGVDDGVLYRVLRKARDCGALLCVHAENRAMVDMLTRECLSRGDTGAWYHYMSRPEFVEAEAVKRALYFAAELDAPIYIVHLACGEGAEAIARARAAGQEVYAETCPQYLEFTREVYRRADGRNFVCSPPMKGDESRRALWAALRRGVISTVATDHCPFNRAEKDWGIGDFTRIPNGCSGIETMYPYMLSAANQGKISLERAVEVCSTNPARIFGLKRKGDIAVGMDADIVIYDPAREVVISQHDLHSDCDHTIWEGVALRGYPEKTFSRGRLVYDSGSFTGERGWGRLLERRPRPTCAHSK